MSAASLFTPNMLNIYSSNAWDGDFYSLLKHSRLIEEIWNRRNRREVRGSDLSQSKRDKYAMRDNDSPLFVSRRLFC